MKTLALPLFLLLFLASFGALTASAQTTAKLLPNQYCVHIENCQVELDNFNWVWVKYSPTTFVWVTTQNGTVLNSCTSFSSFSNTGQPDGSVNLHLECAGTNGLITVDENWISYGTRVGTRYRINGRTVSY
jgi:hypothetical protein